MSRQLGTAFSDAAARPPIQDPDVPPVHPYPGPGAHIGRHGTAETFPDPSIVAAIRFRPLPDAPPDPLRAFTVRHSDPSGDDWLLSDDAVAFGSPLVVRNYLAWRATWVRELELEPLGSVLALADLFDDGLTAATWSGAWLDGRAALVEHPGVVADMLHAAHRRVGGRALQGIGIVNATPGRHTAGLVRAWSPAMGSQVVAGSDAVEAAVDPERGLCVRRVRAGRTITELAGVHEVAVDDDGVVVAGESGQLRLDHHQARPLAWLVPGATRWRVRQVPEVLVWAKTFSRLAEACESSEREGLPLELRVGFRVSSG
jgi:hypothetical protein